MCARAREQREQREQDAHLASEIRSKFHVLLAVAFIAKPKHVELHSRRDAAVIGLGVLNQRGLVWFDQDT